jgi:hypothetical protein
MKIRKNLIIFTRAPRLRAPRGARRGKKVQSPRHFFNRLEPAAGRPSGRRAFKSNRKCGGSIPGIDSKKEAIFMGNFFS